jgi:dTDP-4-amino-4,6-dideoxygalactose transaminase
LGLEVKLELLEKKNIQRKFLAERYQKFLADLPVKFQVEFKGHRSAWHLMVIRLKQRDKLKSFLENRGIASDVYYPYPVHLQPLFKNFKKIQLNNTELLCNELLALPLYPNLSIEKQNKIIKSVREFFNKS